MSMLEENFTVVNVEAVGPELGRRRIEEVIKRGQNRAGRVIEYVRNLQPVDRVAKVSKIDFEFDDNKIHVCLPGDITETIHNHALHQMVDKAKIPWAFAAHLKEQGQWGTELLVSNLNELFDHLEGKALLRSVNGEVRGFLSDRYRRYDSRPIVDAFAKVCKEVGALPYEGYALDTKIGIQAIIPKVYEPITNEIMAYGVNFENSDFGNGALHVGFFIIRLVNLHGIIGPSRFRKIHLGAQLKEDIEWSKKTYDLDQKTIISSMEDLVKAELSEKRINYMQAAIKEAFMLKLDGGVKTTLLELLKRFMTKGELEKALAKFNEPDIETLPPGNNAWRLSNAVAWLASQTEDEERQLELMKVAGRVLPENPAVED